MIPICVLVWAVFTGHPWIATSLLLHVIAKACIMLVRFSADE